MFDLFLVGSEFFEHLPNLIKTAWNVETTFPFATFEGEQDFTATVEIAEPFGIFCVSEVFPNVVMNAFEPFEAAFVTGEAIAFDHGDESFDVNPPKFLVPFEFLSGVAFEVHEVEDAAVFFIPAVFNHLKSGFFCFFDEFGTVETLAEIHEEPH